MSQETVWIVSYPRSGNTWVRLLLEHSSGLETESVYAKDRSGEDIVVLGDAHLTRRQEVRLLKAHATSVPGNDDVIYIVRDGRDATVSYWHYLKDQEGRQVQGFSDFLRSLPSSGSWWAYHVHAWLEAEHPHRLLVVRYEDLHKDQEHELARILGFLELEPIRPFSNYGDQITFERLHARLPTFFRAGRIGGWRDVFSQDDERFFLAHDLGYLSKLGYIQPDDHARVSRIRSEIGSDALVRSLIQRSILFEGTLEEKERVILELDRELRNLRTERGGRLRTLSGNLRTLLWNVFQRLLNNLPRIRG